MPIQKNASGGMSKFITDPGEYSVEISDVQFGKSKKGDSMVTIKFETEDERSIKAFFVQKHTFMMENLGKLKVACGEKPDASSEKLIGKKCGILVEAGKINERGQAFPQIVGFGLASEVDHAKMPTGYQAATAPDSTDNIPF